MVDSVESVFFRGLTFWFDSVESELECCSCLNLGIHDVIGTFF
ncbi:hypothetical protein HanIR_Chr11g0552901 [Helianthus annuus]|nr:hypothetical protein HanIR_Chr11g0552901 [Helianthus annuus]